MGIDSDTKQRAGTLYSRIMELLCVDVKDVKTAWNEFSTLDGQRIKGPKSAMLHLTFQQAADLAQALNWEGTAVLKNGRVLIDHDGVLLESGDLRYFRKGGKSAAFKMLAFLDRHNVPVRTVFDVGANVGEIALYIAHQCTNARVFAFEPAADGIDAFETNLSLQHNPITNLTLVKEAVSNKTGEIEITVGGNSLNTIMVETDLDRLRKTGEIRVDRVPTDTLEGYCNRFGVDVIDFLKVDIEGAEPLLGPSIRNMEGRIGAAYVEISQYNTVESYLDLIAAFEAAGLVMLGKGDVIVPDPEVLIREQLKTGPAINVWFLKREQLPDDIKKDDIKKKKKLKPYKLKRFSTAHFEHISDYEYSKELFASNVTKIDLELFSYCNRKCSFCPNSFIDRISKNEYLDKKLYNIIINNLKEIDFRNKVVLNFYNEPLADPISLKACRELRDNLPHAKLIMNTNGDYLNRETLDAYRDAGLNLMMISIHLGNTTEWDDDKIIRRVKMMGRRIKLEPKILKHKKNSISVVFPYKGMAIEMKEGDYDNQGYDIGGLMKHIPGSPRMSPCLEPFRSITITYNGNITACCRIRGDADEHKPFVIGNLSEFSSLFQVWANSDLVNWRRHLVRYGSKEGPCVNCKAVLFPDTEEVQKTSDEIVRKYFGGKEGGL